MIGYDRILGNSNFDMSDFETDSISQDIANATQAAEYIKQDKGINPNYLIPPFPFFDNAQNREDMAGFLTSARVVDCCAGIVMDAIRESGHVDDTFIIFTTDHGIAFPKMKCNLYDKGIGVSLILKFPENKRKGEAVDALVSQIDLFPTLCEVLSLDKPSWLQGTSIMPLMGGTDIRVRDELFADVTYHAAYEPVRAIRTERYKLIKYFDIHESFVPAKYR